MSESLRDQLLHHLDQKPVPVFEDYLNWKDRLDRLREKVIRDRSVGEDLSRYALATRPTRRDVLQTEASLRDLQARVAANAGQEIIIVERRVEPKGCDRYDREPVSYPYSLIRSGHIREGVLRGRIDDKTLLRHPFMYLEIPMVDGYIKFSTNIAAWWYGLGLTHHPENMPVPSLEDLCEIGNTAVALWRNLDPRNKAIYQKTKTFRSPQFVRGPLATDSSSANA